MANNKDSAVLISLEEYAELIAIKTRVDVAVDILCRNEYVNIEELLWILGAELAIETAMELREKPPKFTNLGRI